MRQIYIWIVIAILGVVYIGAAWTPSHYGYALSMIGAPEAGPDLGSAHFIRSDDWSIQTPNFQIAVRNKFKRINNSSPYHENLRGIWALPLDDWALVFKPQVWAFFVLDPAYAYSIYWYFIFVAFFMGWYLFICALGVDRRVALLGSLALFFSQFYQLWWTGLAPVVALGPWSALIFLTKWRWWHKLPALFYVTAVWFLAQVYPPYIVVEVFAMVVAILAVRPEAFRPANLAIAAVAALGAVAVVYGYFGEIFTLMRETIYPGHRVSVGGGVAGVQLLSHFFPFASTIKFDPIIPLNQCEVSVIGTFLPLMAVIFADHRALITHWRQNWWTPAVFAVGLLLIAGWLTQCLPPVIGTLFLWHVVPGPRMLAGSGLLLTIAVLVLFTTTPWRFTAIRFALFAALVVGVWGIEKGGLPFESQVEGWWDVIPLVLLGVVFVVRRFLSRAAHAEPVYALAGVAALTNIVTFGTFNPLQSAKPIFHPPETAVLKSWRRLAADHPQGWLVLDGWYGSVPNGLGIPSINHVQIAPQLAFFRARFPQMDSASFDNVFNRYAAIVPSTAIQQPRICNFDCVLVPMAAFGAPNTPLPPQTTVVPTLTGRFPPGGWVDAIRRGNPTVVVGWGLFSADSPNRSLRLRTAAPIEAVKVEVKPRIDVVAALNEDKLVYSGFQITLTLAQPADLKDLCLVSNDAVFGERTLVMPAGEGACADLSR